ncbi:hypothetical protein HDU93_007673 [Gonapodya sp. JEL0774]|nr:hypothetical protein HDU93_007673 [Gonapodya sp. JEL0774]
MSLFDDIGDIELTINPTFAEKYETKKRKEELSQLRDKYGDVDLDGNPIDRRGDDGDGDGDDDSEEGELEDEVAELVTPEVDAKIMRTIAMLRARDPRIYDPKTKIFDNETLEEARERRNKARLEQASKPTTLKDYHRQALLEGGAMYKEESDDEEKVGDRPLTYVDEERQVKQEFQRAVAETTAHEDDFFTVRNRTEDEVAAEEEQYREFLMKEIEANDKSTADAIKRWSAIRANEDNESSDGAEEIDHDGLQEPARASRAKPIAARATKQTSTTSLDLSHLSTGDAVLRKAKHAAHVAEGEGGIDDNEAFLWDYLLNRGWLSHTATRPPNGPHPSAALYRPGSPEAVSDADSSDSEEQAEQFERLYNFRFEEPQSNVIIGHSRNVEGSVRRKDERRKTERQRREERKEEERKRREEEVRRLKNLRREEEEAKLKKIREMAGVDDLPLLTDPSLLTADFDPAAHDALMAKAFDDTYYASKGGEHSDDEGEEDDDPRVGLDELLMEGPEDYEPEEEKDVEHMLHPDRARAMEESRVESEGADISGAQEGKKRRKKKKRGDDEMIEPDEEEGFVMDADYLPGGAKYGIIEEEEETKLGKGRKRKDRKTDKKKKKKGAQEGSTENGVEGLDGDVAKKVEDELDKLDFEDVIGGDLATRFKYTTTSTESFGLTPVEILLADDKELNELISLKKLAPYRAAERQKRDLAKWRWERGKKLAEFRRKFRERERRRKEGKVKKENGVVESADENEKEHGAMDRNSANADGADLDADVLSEDKALGGGKRKLEEEIISTSTTEEPATHRTKKRKKANAKEGMSAPASSAQAVEAGGQLEPSEIPSIPLLLASTDDSAALTVDLPRPKKNPLLKSGPLAPPKAPLPDRAEDLGLARLKSYGLDVAGGNQKAKEEKQKATEERERKMKEKKKKKRQKKKEKAKTGARIGQT